MPIWSTEPIETQPSLKFRNYYILELPDKSRHLVGTVPGQDPGRVSSKIIEFDSEKRQVRTQSGRIYQLDGEPTDRPNLDALYVWSIWCTINQIDSKDCRNVSQEYCSPQSSDPG